MGKLDWVLSLVLAAQPAGAEAPLAITVQVMNNMDVPDVEVHQAEVEAGLMFKRAGIEILWVDCHPQIAEVPSPRCKSIDVPMLFVLSIKTGTGPNGSVEALGYALMQGHANHAVVLYPRIAELVESHPEYANCTILGSVMAHELAHLVFHTTHHGLGVMRARWDRRDFQAMAQRRLRFSDEQAKKLREMLVVRMASSGTGVARPAVLGLR